MNIVAIFGTFDGIHEGHINFITQAQSLGDRLVAIVARDQVVERLKGAKPKHSETDRVLALSKIPEVDIVLLGDIEDDTYTTLREVQPTIIFLGYDQDALEESLVEAMHKNMIPAVRIVRGAPYKETEFHSSLLHKQ